MNAPDTHGFQGQKMTTELLHGAPQIMDRMSRAMDECRLDGCDAPGILKGSFCTEAHRDEHRRAGSRKRVEKHRAAQRGEVIEAQSGRSIGGQAEHWPATPCHPSRLFARSEEPETVDYTKPGATDRRRHQPTIAEQRQRGLLQRFRPPTVAADEDEWTPPGNEDYYGGVSFPGPDMGDGPYSGYNHAGTPLLFQVVRRSR